MPLECQGEACNASHDLCEAEVRSLMTSCSHQSPSLAPLCVCDDIAKCNAPCFSLTYGAGEVAPELVWGYMPCSWT